MTGDRGSITPLILGFFLLGLLIVAGSVAAADAYVQQRDLQDVCDGAVAAAAAGGADLGRGSGFATGSDLRFADVQQRVERYLQDDRSRSNVRGVAAMSADATTITLTCTEQRPIAFGAMFGLGTGVHHTAHASARAPIS